MLRIAPNYDKTTGQLAESMGAARQGGLVMAQGAHRKLNR